jgi:uncharacterized protein (UPF0332 family)
MTGRDFLPLATRLAAGSEEADWRTAISRAYYAAFHVSRDLLFQLGFVVPPDEKAHNFLYVRLNNCGNTAIGTTAGNLHALRRLRNAADYDMSKTIDAQLASNQVRLASTIIQTLDNLTPAERTQIHGAMIVYERDVLQNVTWRP